MLGESMAGANATWSSFLTASHPLLATSPSGDATGVSSLLSAGPSFLPPVQVQSSARFRMMDAQRSPNPNGASASSSSRSAQSTPTKRHAFNPSHSSSSSRHTPVSARNGTKRGRADDDDDEYNHDSSRMDSDMGGGGSFGFVPTQLIRGSTEPTLSHGNDHDSHDHTSGRAPPPPAKKLRPLNIDPQHTPRMEMSASAGMQPHWLGTIPPSASLPTSLSTSPAFHPMAGNVPLHTSVSFLPPSAAPSPLPPPSFSQTPHQMQQQHPTQCQPQMQTLQSFSFATQHQHQQQQQQSSMHSSFSGRPIELICSRDTPHMLHQTDPLSSPPSSPMQRPSTPSHNSPSHASAGSTHTAASLPHLQTVRHRSSTISGSSGSSGSGSSMRFAIGHTPSPQSTHPTSPSAAGRASSPSFPHTSTSSTFSFLSSPSTPLVAGAQHPSASCSMAQQQQMLPPSAIHGNGTEQQGGGVEIGIGYMYVPPSLAAHSSKLHGQVEQQQQQQQQHFNPAHMHLLEQSSSSHMADGPSGMEE